MSVVVLRDLVDKELVLICFCCFFVFPAAVMAATCTLAVPMVYTVSPRPLKGQPGAVSIVVSTIDSDGTVTDIGPVIGTIIKALSVDFALFSR